MDGHHPRPPVILAVGVAAVSWAAIFVRLCHAPGLVVAVYRLALSVLFLIPVCLLRREAGHLGLLRNFSPWVILSGIFLGCHFVAWIEAVQRVSVVVAVTLSSTHPIFVGVLSWALMRERVGYGLASGIILALSGTALISWSDAGMTEWEWIGYGLALGGALFFAGYVMVGRRIRRTVDLMGYVLPAYSTAAVFLLAIALVADVPLVGYDAQTYSMFFLLALVPTAIGHSIINWALRYVPATLVALSVLGEPVGATVLAAFLFRELPSALKVLGGSIILLGIYFAARSEVSGGQSRSARTPKVLR